MEGLYSLSVFTFLFYEHQEDENIAEEKEEFPNSQYNFLGTWQAACINIQMPCASLCPSCFCSVGHLCTYTTTAETTLTSKQVKSRPYKLRLKN